MKTKIIKTFLSGKEDKEENVKNVHIFMSKTVNSPISYNVSYKERIKTLK
jgi:hypothetical protein